MEEATECTVVTFADDTHLEEQVHTRGQDYRSEDLHRLEKQAEGRANPQGQTLSPAPGQEAPMRGQRLGPAPR